MRSILGVLSFALGTLAALVFGVWTMSLSVTLVNEVAGLWPAVLAVVLFPVTVAIVPWYSVVARGDWTPLLVGYGGGLLALLLLGAGAAVIVSHLGSNSGFGKPRRRFLFGARSDS